uniref:Uncharacterized protein n=1 Tax=Anguilla anguilla TaxID=7936 RepID=A0A0E9PVU3_ANGAN
MRVLGTLKKKRKKVQHGEKGEKSFPCFLKTKHTISRTDKGQTDSVTN